MARKPVRLVTRHADATGHVVTGFLTGIIRVMPSSPARTTPASIIVPTFQEALNIEPLVERVFAALAKAGRRAEMIVVDDNSRDGMEEKIETLATQYPVRLVVRRTERGLSSAVLAGFREAQFDQFVVLDADLQHPPELIPAMLDQLDQGSGDFVIGTRYSREGAVSRAWPWWRRLGSRVATVLAKPLAPVSDPMSGFFALHRTTFEHSDELDPIGYKIALELYVKGRCRRPVEVPIQFAARSAGESKFNLAEQVRYLRHLSRLYRYRFPWLMPVLTLLVLVGAVATVMWLV